MTYATQGAVTATPQQSISGVQGTSATQGYESEAVYGTALNTKALKKFYNESQKQQETEMLNDLKQDYENTLKEYEQNAKESKATDISATEKALKTEYNNWYGDAKTTYNDIVNERNDLAKNYNSYVEESNKQLSDFQNQMNNQSGEAWNKYVTDIKTLLQESNPNVSSSEITSYFNTNKNKILSEYKSDYVSQMVNSMKSLIEQNVNAFNSDIKDYDSLISNLETSLKSSNSEYNSSLNELVKSIDDAYDNTIKNGKANLESTYKSNIQQTKKYIKDNLDNDYKNVLKFYGFKLKGKQIKPLKLKKYNSKFTKSQTLKANINKAKIKAITKIQKHYSLKGKIHTPKQTKIKPIQHPKFKLSHKKAQKKVTFRVNYQKKPLRKSLFPMNKKSTHRR